MTMTMETCKAVGIWKATPHLAYVSLILLISLTSVTSVEAIAPAENISGVQYRLDGALDSLDATSSDSFSGFLNVDVGHETGTVYWLESFSFASGSLDLNYPDDLTDDFFDMTTTGSPAFTITFLDADFSGAGVSIFLDVNSPLTGSVETEGGTANFQNATINLVPEPSTAALAGLALLPLGFLRWRRRRR